MTAGPPVVPGAAEGSLPSAPVASIRGASLGDRIYRIATLACATAVPILLLLIAFEIGSAAWPALDKAGLSFLTSSDWDPVRENFGAAPMIYGTIVSSLIALVLATPLALGVAVFLSEFASPRIRQPIAFLVDLLAAIPSVVYGLWGVFVLMPILREDLMPFLADTLKLGNTPFFSGPAYGPSMLAAGIILAIMILPYISAVSREVLMAVPRSQREAALALGATRWETIRDAVVPYARSGILGGIILGLARALGEKWRSPCSSATAMRSRPLSSPPAIRWPPSSPTNSPKQRESCTPPPSWRAVRCCSP